MNISLGDNRVLITNGNSGIGDPGIKPCRSPKSAADAV
jgi:hypothetical protein